MRAEGRRGFTVMELLVVIALITLLTAILFPVIAGARARARQSRCASQLHQLAQAGLIYLADYDERFLSIYRHPTRQYAIDLPTVLHAYVGDRRVFYCPDRTTVHPNCVDQTGTFGTPVRCMGYGYNWGSGIGWLGSSDKRDGLVLAGPKSGQAIGVTLAEVAQPAHCLFLGDTNDHDLLSLWREVMPGVQAADSVCAAPGTSGEPVNARGDAYEPPRHGGGNHFAFVDGHVAWLRFPGGRYEDGGPWVVPDMSMYSRTGRWETGRLP